MVVDRALVEPIWAIEESPGVPHPFQLLNVCMHMSERHCTHLSIYDMVYVAAYASLCVMCICACTCACTGAHACEHDIPIMYMQCMQAQTHIHVCCMRARIHATVIQHCF